MITFFCIISLLRSVHKTDSAHLAGSDSIFLFIFITQCVTPGLNYCTWSKPFKEYRILHFLTGFFFSVHLSASQILINLSLQHTHEVKMVSPVYRWETKAQRLRTKVTKISTNLDVQHDNFQEYLAFYNTWYVQNRVSVVSTHHFCKTGPKCLKVGTKEGREKKVATSEKFGISDLFSITNSVADAEIESGVHPPHAVPYFTHLPISWDKGPTKFFMGKYKKVSYTKLH